MGSDESSASRSPKPGVASVNTSRKRVEAVAGTEIIIGAWVKAYMQAGLKRVTGKFGQRYAACRPVQLRAGPDNPAGASGDAEFAAAQRERPVGLVNSSVTSCYSNGGQQFTEVSGSPSIDCWGALTGCVAISDIGRGERPGPSICRKSDRFHILEIGTPLRPPAGAGRSLYRFVRP